MVVVVVKIRTEGKTAPRSVFTATAARFLALGEIT